MLKITAFALFAAFLSAQTAGAQTMTLTSPDIAPGARIADEQVLNGFGCTGGNISPALSWSGAPKDTKSFALSVYDPDAPTGSGFWHWVFFNIPPDVTSLPKGAGDTKSAASPKGAVKFFDASNAAKMPLLAARPGLKLLFIEPNDSRKPTGCDAARPIAHTICC